MAKNAGQVALEMGKSAGIVLKHYHEIVEAKAAREFFSQKTTRFRLASEGLQRDRQREQRLSFAGAKAISEVL